MRAGGPCTQVTTPVERHWQRARNIRECPPRHWPVIECDQKMQGGGPRTQVTTPVERHWQRARNIRECPPRHWPVIECDQKLRAGGPRTQVTTLVERHWQRARNIRECPPRHWPVIECDQKLRTLKTPTPSKRCRLGIVVDTCYSSSSCRSANLRSSISRPTPSFPISLRC
jgi:hypothetical protein